FGSSGSKVSIAVPECELWLVVRPPARYPDGAGRNHPEAGSIRGDAMRTMKAGTIIDTPIAESRYRVAELLGEGGCGRAYRVHRLDAMERPVEELCLKVTLDPEGWHREAYFGELLKSCDRAIHMYESFPLFPPKKGQDVRYCLVFELAACGT